MTYSSNYLRWVTAVAEGIDTEAVERMVDLILNVRDGGGRLFMIGSGGGAGHASHAVCDFRKLCGVESYCPTDNVSELTARINDDGWDTSLENYLRGSRFSAKDCVFVFLVGGGNAEEKISTNLVNAIRFAKERGGKVAGVVGRDGGETLKAADVCVLVPAVESSAVTPLTESYQAVVWHLVVSHPRLQLHTAKWESTVHPDRIREGR